MPPLVTEYDELKVRIDPGRAGSYDVLATTQLANVSGSFELPFGELEIENFVLKVSRSRGRRRLDASALGDAKRFGGPLFRALFREQINALYHDALSDARNRGHGLRITLCLNGAPELMDVPWEYLFDEPDFLAASSFTPVVRYLDLSRGHRPLRVEPPLRVLGVVSSPSDYDQLDVERERANLKGALSSLIDDGSVELHWLERPSLKALLRRFQTETFHCFHYIGHGSYDERAEEGVLLFEDEDGRGRPVSGDKLGMILHDFTSLRLAVLNACEGARTSRSDPFAGVAGSLVRRDIPAVVAMQFEISDEAAIAFAGGFYEALAMGCPADTSVAAARLAMLAERSDDIEWGTPVLFMRVPDGRLFELGEPRPRPSSVSDEAPETPSAPATARPAIDPPATDVLETRPVTRVGAPVPPLPRDDPSTGGWSPVEHGGSQPSDHRPRRRWRWLLPIPIVVLVALLLGVLRSPSQSDASVAEGWLRTIDTGNYVKAASYWSTPGFWTGLKGGTTYMTTPAAILAQVRRNGKCHKLIEAVTISQTNHTVRLRVYTDRSLPGRTCSGVRASWNEDYYIRDGHIIAVIFRFLPGTGPQTQNPPSHSATSTTASGTGSTASSEAAPGPGYSSAGAAPSGGTSTQSAAVPPTSSTSPAAASTTTATVPTPPTSTTP